EIFGQAHTIADQTINLFGYEASLPTVICLLLFCGAVGKSAQLPLHVWLPDAMEGPTPVSALVHSATMVAAGVYLAGRFFPMFVQEVLLTIAYTGCITLFLAATIAMVATDIKKVLAYSTISQLGYMMLGIGVFGWAAGLFHLITHAFFKSLMFLCSGSVIHGCHHEQEMPKMGGLLKKMPITAITMLIGVIAISGLAIPGVIAFSGYHSKDAIVASALAFTKANSAHFLLFFIPLLTAGITAFYMFRLWFYTFWGAPRDQHVHDHAHESPWIMTAPLLILSVFAAFCAVGGDHGYLYLLLTGDEPAHLEAGVTAVGDGITLPAIQDIVNAHDTAGTLALVAAVSGTLIAYILYGTNFVNVEEMKRQLAGVHGFLTNKWHFDELYDALFMRPAHKVAAFCAWFDGAVFDRILHGAAKATVVVSKWDRVFDENVVDGFVNLIASATQSVGTSLKVVQTGRLRQYVMFIVLGVVALFAVMFTTFPG
ncbi:MAG: NADH-quinone oxidoreductase subunit L, partial [Fuerstiella sp.]|nr:NADH-quinone oxidoreductase subunit L [Fuerstiella sp.]